MSRKNCPVGQIFRRNLYDRTVSRKILCYRTSLSADNSFRDNDITLYSAFIFDLCSSKQRSFELRCMIFDFLHDRWTEIRQGPYFWSEVSDVWFIFCDKKWKWCKLMKKELKGQGNQTNRICSDQKTCSYASWNNRRRTELESMKEGSSTTELRENSASDN